jgi:CheY-like chemotaxis protein
MRPSHSSPPVTRNERRVREVDRRRAPRGGRRETDHRQSRSQALPSILVDLRRRLGRAPLILVVDDYLDAREMMAEYFAFCGWRTITAASGAEAIERTATLRPDAILLDLVMPDMDGFEVMARLKQSEPTHLTKIVVFTAHALSDTRARVGPTGAIFIPKPCAPELVALQIAYLLAEERPNAASA